jgi:hypothetical protein
MDNTLADRLDIMLAAIRFPGRLALSSKQTDQRHSETFQKCSTLHLTPSWFSGGI